MKLSRLKIRNFRCFGDQEKTIEFDDLTTFIGINSSGKTAVLIALIKLFGRSASRRSLERGDFHVPKGIEVEKMREQDLHIEAIIEFPELDDEFDDIAKNTVPLAWQHFTVDEPNGKPYVRLRLEAKWNSGNSPDGDIEQKYFFITSSENEDEIPEDHKSPASNLDLSKVEIIYVPAIRNPETQLKNASGTILWRILRGINWPAEINQQVTQIGREVDEQLSNVGGFALLQEVLPREWKKLHSDIRYTNVSISFNADDFSELLGKLDARFFPAEIPGSYSVTSLGEGLRSLFYLSLVSSLLQFESHALQDVHKDGGNAEKGEDSNNPNLFNPDFVPPLLTMLAIEEPENHIAPHLIGRIMNVLDNISGQSNAQVAVTSHSPSIVKRVHPESIRYLRMCHENLFTIVNRLELPDSNDEKYKYVKEAVQAYPEIYFARFVVLGEGDTEEIVIPKALLSHGLTLDGSAVSVVPLGGRMVNHFWKLLESIDIPYATLLDLDLERGTGGWARIKYVIQQLQKHQGNPSLLLRELIEKGIMSNQIELQELHMRGTNYEQIKICLSLLESHGVFFAEPLDMDFMMLKAFPEAYKNTVEDRGGSGPRIPDQEDDPINFRDYTEKAVSATLKSDKARGEHYSDADKLLMVWYKYLFLERGKPSTHLLAIAHLRDGEFFEKLPDSIKRLLQYVEELLKKDPQSLLYQEEQGA
jgi:predicted ATP-dependent endonuclease of OLD family